MVMIYILNLSLQGADPGFSEEGVQMYKRGVCLPNLKQNFLKFSMKME